MHISGRQRQILELLLNHKNEITAGEIAEEIKVSVRTVHRELSELEAVLAANGVSLQKKSGKGIYLQAPDHKLAALRQLVAAGDVADYSSEDRKLLILITLLQEAEPLKLFTLAHDLGVTVSTVSNDLNELESLIGKNGLELVRRRGYGIEIAGPESRRRNAICELAKQHLDDSDLFGGMPDQPQSSVTSRLLALMGKEHLLTVEAALWQTSEQSWLNRLSESDYTDLLLCLTVSVNRMKQGRFIEEEEECGEEGLDEHQKTLLRSLSDSLQMDFPDGEACHLAQLLELRKGSDFHQLLSENELNLRELVQRLIADLEERLNIPFGIDRSLREGLVSHMENALQRLQAGDAIRNPLLAPIKRDYEELFAVIRQAVNETMSGIDVPDEEVGFLVMHFGASIERLKQFGRKVRAIIVCTSGIGSSKMLAVRLNKELPEIEIVGHVSWFEASRIPEESYDLIISTVNLPIEPERYFKLSPLLTKSEAEKLRAYVHDVILKEKLMDKAEAADGADAVKRLYRLQTYLNEIVRIVDQFEVHHLNPSGCTLEETLRQACGKIAQRGGLHDAEAVVQLLIERQKMSSQVIPDTRIALFHTRSEHIAKPSFTLFRLSANLPLDNDSAAEVRHLLLMLGPRELSKESLEVLSEISSFLLNEEMVTLLESGTRQHIQQYLSQELAVFFANLNNADMRRDLR
jgi:mannitol operon transcriptional antiterminator